MNPHKTPLGMEISCLLKSLCRLTTEKASKLCLTGPFCWESTDNCQCKNFIMKNNIPALTKNNFYIFGTSMILLDVNHTYVLVQAHGCLHLPECCVILAMPCWLHFKEQGEFLRLISMEMLWHRNIFALLVSLCEGNPQVTGGFP